MSYVELRSKLAANPNHVANIITRTISVSRKLDLEVGSLYNNQGLTESWSDETSSMDFLPENERNYEYTFICHNVPCFKVDYEDEELCEQLDCENCESEGEVLIHSDIKMEIVHVATDDDYEEMGYYEIHLELVV